MKSDLLLFKRLNKGGNEQAEDEDEEGDGFDYLRHKDAYFLLDVKGDHPIPLFIAYNQLTQRLLIYLSDRRLRL